MFRKRPAGSVLNSFSIRSLQFHKSKPIKSAQACTLRKIYIATFGDLKEKFWIFVDFDFLTGNGLFRHQVNQFPLVSEKSSNGKWLKTAFKKKNANALVLCAEMLVT